VEVTLQTVELDADIKPCWIFFVMFNENDDSVAWEWRIDSVAVTIEPDNSFEIEYWRFPNNPWPDDFSEDDPTWDQYRRLVTGESFLKTMNLRL